MRQPQVLVYEADGRIAALLREAGKDRKDRKEPRWTLHEPRQPEACLRLLRHGGGGVLVLRLGSVAPPEVAQAGPGGPAETAPERAVVRELGLLERVTWRCPEAATVVVGDADHADLEAVCWDLGAAYVLLPPRPRDWMPDIVAGLLGLPAGRPDQPPTAPRADE
jgi:hypothetical protein